MSVVFLAAILIISVYFFPRIYRYFCRIIHILKLGAEIPGPKGIPILGNTLQIPYEPTKYTSYFCGIAADSLKQGKNVMKLWLMDNMKVFPLNGHSMKDVLDNSEEITKSEDYDILQPWLGTGLVVSTGSKWRHRRKMLTPTFHFSMLDGYVETFDREARLMTNILEKSSNNGQTVDVVPFIKRCTLDIICDTAMGIRLNSQQLRDHPYAVAVAEMSTITTEHAFKPWLWLKPIWYLSGYGGRYDVTLKQLTDFTKNIIKEHKAEVEKNGFAVSEGKKKAFLDLLLELGEKNSLSDEDIREEVDTFMFAGHDTTSTGVSWTLWSLACHPDIQEKVAEELHGVFGDSDRSMTVDDLKCLPYLERVIKETMRLNPPIPWVGRRLVNDMKIGDYTAPRGAEAFIAPLIVHRNAEVYPEPLKFDPDRFLPENVAKRHTYDYIPFSAGPRNCIGQKFAMFEQKVLVSWIVRRFKISSQIPFHANGLFPEITLRPEHGVPIKLERRISN